MEDRGRVEESKSGVGTDVSGHEVRVTGVTGEGLVWDDEESVTTQEGREEENRLSTSREFRD